MELELKIKLIDPQAVENKLQTLEATVTDETEFTDTYFNQPDGEVFKVSDTKAGYFLKRLQRTPEGRFKFTKNNKIENADEVIAEMRNEFGVKCVLKGKRQTYTLDGLNIQ